MHMEIIPIILHVHVADDILKPLKLSVEVKDEFVAPLVPSPPEK
jgi:hypothetical protein